MVALDKTASVIDSAGTIVIKIGSSILVDDDSHSVNAAWLAGIAGDIAALRADGKNVVVVSSGAIALGSHVLGLGGQTLALEEKQAAAAAGGSLARSLNSFPSYTRCVTTWILPFSSPL